MQLASDYFAMQNGNMSGKSEEKQLSLSSAKDHIDTSAFEQIQEMDDNDDREFSKTIVSEFFAQAEKTFTQMQALMYCFRTWGYTLHRKPLTVVWAYRKKEDLPELSSLGHYLKGSSATLGLIKIKQACEDIQNLGMGLDENGEKPKKPLDKQATLALIQSKLQTMKIDLNHVKFCLRVFYKYNFEPKV